jgi:hypothetical protein
MVKIQDFFNDENKKIAKDDKVSWFFKIFWLSPIIPQNFSQI